MMQLKKLIRSCLPLLLAVTLLAGAAQAALLEVGPTVPQVIGSTVPNLGHGYPSWYRDSNRVPLELCLNEAMCFFAPPDPALPVSFPGNVPDELFYWAGDAVIPLASGGQAILVQALEAAYSTGGVVPGAQITFARIRIRIDTNVAGNYVVTTPFKQYTFTNVPVGVSGINFTEDIGIGADGVFTGALTGSVGPFLYCTDAPFPATDGSGGSYIGKNAVACPVLGSTFTDPVTGQPANLFRVQGPAGFGGLPSGTVQTADFRVQGKLFTTVTPTPLTVDKATYALDTAGLRLSAFATTNAISNQTGTGAFPLNFALGGVPSALQLSATGITAQAMTTNSPADGSFFVTSGPVAVALPATVTVTNTADLPPTVVTAPLVDDVVISTATYNPGTKVLAITATSSDAVNAPALQAFMPGMTAPLGTLAAGVLNVTFPVLDTTVIPNKTYSIPPKTITVTSAKGGSATAPVSSFTPPVLPATGVILAPTVTSPQLSGTAITVNAVATGGDAGPYEYRFWWRQSGATGVWALGQAYSPTATWTWNTTGLPAATYYIQVDTRHTGTTVKSEAAKMITYDLTIPVLPATGVTLTPTVASPQPAGTAVTVNAAATGGDAGPYEYRFWWRQSGTTGVWALGQAYSPTATWTWNTTGLPAATYYIQVDTRHAGTTVKSEAAKMITFGVTP